MPTGVNTMRVHQKLGEYTKNTGEYTENTGEYTENTGEYTTDTLASCHR